MGREGPQKRSIRDETFEGDDSTNLSPEEIAKHFANRPEPNYGNKDQRAKMHPNYERQIQEEARLKAVMPKHGEMLTIIQRAKDGRALDTSAQKAERGQMNGEVTKNNPANLGSIVTEKVTNIFREGESLIIKTVSGSEYEIRKGQN